MIFAASCTGGYVLFHSQQRELAALHANDQDESTSSPASTSANANSAATTGAGKETSSS